MAFLLAFINRQFIYTPPVPTASFEGKTLIVTGGSAGLGKEAIRWLIKLKASSIILACRNIDKGEAAAKEIQESTACSGDIIQVWQLDMSSYASVLAFVEKAKSLPRLDGLVSNAGLGTRTFRKTEDNEEMITTNVVSLFLHAFLLLPQLRETAKKYNTPTYFTITASELYEVARFKEQKAPAGQLFAALADEKQASMLDRYNVSKLLEVFTVKQLAVLSPLDTGKVIVNCTAPGLCATELHREAGNSLPIRALKKFFCRPSEVGARTIVHGASAGPESHGQYVPDCRITVTGGLTKGKTGLELQDRVWDELKVKLEGIKPGVTSIF